MNKNRWMQAPSKCDLSSTHMGVNEFESLREALAINWLSPLGPYADPLWLEVAALLGLLLKRGLAESD
jgi:hypothetical protein